MGKQQLAHDKSESTEEYIAPAFAIESRLNPASHKFHQADKLSCQAHCSNANIESKRVPAERGMFCGPLKAAKAGTQSYATSICHAKVMTLAVYKTVSTRVRKPCRLT